MLNWPCSPKEGVQQIKPNHINTMNEELKDDEVIILDELCKEALTYRVYEDNAGGLHFTVYQEDEEFARLLGICYNVRPEEIKTCIEDLTDFMDWEGMILRNNEEGMDIDAENSVLFNTCKIIDETYIKKHLGLRRDINYSVMGAAGQEAYLG